MQPVTDRFRFWYAHLAVIDRSFEHKTHKFVVCVVFFISAGKSLCFFQYDRCMVADSETVVNSLVFLERCLWLSVIDWLDTDWVIAKCDSFLKVHRLRWLKSWPEERSLYEVHDLGATFRAVAKYGIYSGAPNERWGFLSNICSEKQILRRIFYHLRTTKNF